MSYSNNDIAYRNANGQTYFKNDASERLFNSLTQSEKDSILENFKLDKEIYENDSLFWNPSL